jgi:hypothetical protein
MVVRQSASLARSRCAKVAPMRSAKTRAVGRVHVRDDDVRGLAASASASASQSAEAPPVTIATLP